MAEKMPIRIRKNFTCVGSLSFEYVKTEIVPPGEIWCLQNISYENEGVGVGVFRRYIEGHGYNHYLGEQTTVAAKVIYSTDDILYLIPGERLVLRQVTPTAADVLALYAHGYKVHSAFIPDKE
jgi:hypothetical protein